MSLNVHGGRAADHRRMTPFGLSEGEDFAALTALIHRNVATRTGSRDELVERLISDAISAFATEQGKPRPAAARVAPLLWELGERQVCHGLGREPLDQGFDHALAAAQRGFLFVVRLPGTVEQALREDLTSYLRLLHRHALTAWKRGCALLSNDDGRLGLLGKLLLDPTQPPPTDRLLDRAGLDPEAEYVLLVSTHATMPDAIFEAADILAGSNGHEALVPCTELDRALGRLRPRQVVVGPARPLRLIGRTAETVRRGAELLRTGRTLDQRVVVPCVDLLSVLVTDGLPGLSELLAAKHLSALEAMSCQRRIREGELLLRWLELGQPINQVARELAIPPQTAHNRLNHLRKVFGGALDDPSQRLELIVALQAALPRWRERDR